MSWQWRLRLFAVAVAFAALSCVGAAAGADSRRDGLIAFAVDMPDHSSDLYVIRADGTAERRLTSTKGIIEDSASWSSDGGRILFSLHSFGGRGYIYSMKPNGSGAKKIFLVPKGWAYPAWSRNWIAFSEDWLDGDPGLFLVGSDGRHFHKIPGTAKDDIVPDWLPNGRQLVFDHPNGGISIIGTGGTGKRQLTGTGLDPAASPDGKHLAFGGGLGPPGIWTARLNGSRVSSMTRVTRGEDWEPTWSPDGRQIAFIRGGAGIGALYVMNADGSKLHQVGKTRLARDPAWQP